MKRRTNHRRLGVRHAVRRPPKHQQSPLRRAMDLARAVDGSPAPLSAAEVARTQLRGRHRSVASIMLRAGRLALALESDRTVALPDGAFDAAPLTWAWMQRTVRRETTAADFARAIKEALGLVARQIAVEGGATHTTALGQSALTFLYELKQLDADPQQVVAAWERWVALRTKDLRTDLQRRPGARGADAYAVAHGGGSLQQIARAVQASASPTPGPHSEALWELDGFENAIATHRQRMKATSRVDG